MFDKLIQQLCHELGLGPVPVVDENKLRPLTVGNVTISAKQLDPGIYFSSKIAPLPKHKKEDFLMRVMKANFLGQGTGGATIGLTEDESFLTLSLSLPYDMNYKSFKDSLEEFANFVDYWKNEIRRHDIEAEKV